MNIFKYKNGLKRGFTLIELLVVISIIGLLSSVVLGSLNTARAKARDARRFSDMKQVQLALELYRDKYGNYPSSDNTSTIRQNSCGSGDTALSVGFNTMPGKWGAALSSTLVPEFMPSLPVDPIGNASGFDLASGNQLCYTYIAPTVNSFYSSCATAGGAGDRLEANNYSYILYFSTETTPPAGTLRSWWSGNNNQWGPVPPTNRCILGPLK